MILHNLWNWLLNHELFGHTPKCDSNGFLAGAA